MKSQRALLLAAGIVAGAAAGTAISEELPARLGACAAIGDQELRLACYDALAEALPAPGNAAARSMPDSAEAAAPPSETFGMEGKAAQAAAVASIPNITARVKTLRELPGGGLIVELDNGQVWERIGSGRPLLLKAGDQVTIQRAMMGSFRLVTEASRAARVRRIR